MCESIEALVAQMEVGRIGERLAAVAALKELGVESAEARVALVEALTDDCPQVQLAAAEAIQAVGVCAKSAFQIVFEVVDTIEDELQSYTGALALHALGIYGEKALGFIREWARIPNQDPRRTAVVFLKYIDVEPEVEIPILIELIKSEQNEWDMAAVLERIRELPQEATIAVLDALDEILVPGNAVVEVINFLGRTAKPQSIVALERLLDADNDQWRLRGAKALMRMHGDKHPKAVSTLTALKDTSADADVAAEAAQHLDAVD